VQGLFDSIIEEAEAGSKRLLSIVEKK
jgi:hypothetical protein